MGEITWRDRLRYRFDNFMSRGTIALVGGLGLLSAIVILVAAVAIVLGKIRPGDEGDSVTFLEAIWLSLMRTLDAGTMGGDVGWRFRLIMFLVTLGGVFIISTLIGILTSGIESKLDELRKGRSRVIEENHTVILGWSPLVFSIISELVEANANKKNSCIVIMGDKDKVEMEEEIQSIVGDTRRTRVVCRRGNPIDLHDLDIVSLPSAKSIIVLSPVCENPDADVIRIILAILNKGIQHLRPLHIVAELRNPHNQEIAHLVGKEYVEFVLVGDLIARIVAQTCRQSGLSVVYRELLDFGGDEIYFKQEPALVGKTFGEALLAYESSAVIGLCSATGQVSLNPPMERKIEPGDQIVAISEDDDTILLNEKLEPSIDERAINLASGIVPKSERILILGWNKSSAVVINELGNYVAHGSEIMIVSDDGQAEAELRSCCAKIDTLKVNFRSGDITDRALLDELQVGTYHYVIVLACGNSASPQDADTRSLMALLHLRDIADRGGYKFAIVTEMLDVRNRALAGIAKADDFVVSDELISLLLSQISENKHLNAVFNDLFDPEGCEVYLKPAGDYVFLDHTVNFYTVIEAARRRGQVAFGYRHSAESGSAQKSYGVLINPDKSKLITFAQGDRIILLAED